MRIKTVKLKLRREHLERLMIGGAAALVLFLAARGSQVPMVEVPYPETTEEVNTIAQTQTPTQRTTIFYKDGNGYLVPVTMEVPQQEGIAKATLSLLTSSPVNDIEAASLGLLTVAPAGTTYELDIADGRARVNLSAEALNTADAAAEAAMVDAIVQTLTSFDTVETVEFLIDGQTRETLTHGTPVSGSFTGGSVNLESVDASASLSGAETVTLYFPDEGGRLLVPVTRTVWGEADLGTAVFELLKGPKEDSGLERALPEDCALIDVSVKDGAAVINLSKEFEQVLSQSDGGKRALRAMMLTCTRFPGVERVEILLEGQPYTVEGMESKPTFVNSATEIEAWFPGVMEFE
ncbi:MAG TPA: GerMN domain-containing protein [Candidatus Aphodomonas merdavium]|nr:GerMN domain-containing protein [Candidatus Aphodomonas merdavium]